MIRIGVVLDPEHSTHWTDFKRFLDPAAKRGQLTEIVGAHELLWAVLDGDTAIAAATTRLCDDGAAEVALVGGSEHRRWIRRLDERIGACAAEAGATRLRAFGRRGWVKTLTRQGWQVMGERDGFTAYERRL